MRKRRAYTKKKKQKGRFRSGLEQEIFDKSLRSVKGAKYESIRVPYIKQHYYVPDWVLPNGIVVEIKGRFTSFDRTKILSVIKLHPELDLRFVFGTNNKLNKNSDTRYSDWCEKRGIKYAFNEIPKEWLLEPKKEIKLNENIVF